jgi:hypothetical protein
LHRAAQLIIGGWRRVEAQGPAPRAVGSLAALEETQADF